MELKEKTNFLNDPRGILLLLRSQEGGFVYCSHCRRVVLPDSETTELAKRVNDDTLLFYRRCPSCGHKLYWQEYHNFGLTAKPKQK